jgi:hypothetical protein
MVKVSVNRFVYQRVNNVRWHVEACAISLRKTARENITVLEVSQEL